MVQKLNVKELHKKYYEDPDFKKGALEIYTPKEIELIENWEPTHKKVLQFLSNHKEKFLRGLIIAGIALFLYAGMVFIDLTFDENGERESTRTEKILGIE
jgi:hypothetical protein